MMITKFKLFLENNTSNENVITITAEEWNYARDNDQIDFPENSLVEIRKVFNPKRIFYFDYDGDTKYEIVGDSDFCESIYLFMDNDYWMYVNYSIAPRPGFNLGVIVDPTYLYHKIDIANGYDNVPEYWVILDEIRNKINTDEYDNEI